MKDFSNLVKCQEENEKKFKRKDKKRVTLIDLFVEHEQMFCDEICITYSFPESRVGFCPADQKAYVKIYGKLTRVLVYADE